MSRRQAKGLTARRRHGHAVPMRCIRCHVSGRGAALHAYRRDRAAIIFALPTSVGYVGSMAVGDVYVTATFMMVLGDVISQHRRHMLLVCSISHPSVWEARCCREHRATPRRGSHRKTARAMRATLRLSGAA